MSSPAKRDYRSKDEMRDVIKVVKKKSRKVNDHITFRPHYILIGIAAIGMITVVAFLATYIVWNYF